MPEIGTSLLEAAQFHHAREDWYVPLFVLMPDHFHALIAPAPDKSLTRLLGDWKRFTAKHQGIVWQKNFIDHRLRSDESWEEKAAYIRSNPVRAGLVRDAAAWPYLLAN